jgi:hypothetical protein
VGKGLNTKIIHEEMFPVYGGKCLSRKAVHNWVANVSLMKRLKRRCGSGFDALVKRWDRCNSVSGGYVEKQMLSSRFEYHMFYVLYPFLTYLLSLPRI